MEEIVVELKPLILSSLRKYYNKAYLYDELFQEGCVKVVEAVLDYDPTLKVPFLAYIKKRLYYFYLGKNHKKKSYRGSGFRLFVLV